MTNIIAVTMGDPAGIGPEIIIKSLVEGKLNGAPVVVVGCAQTLRRILAMGITRPPSCVSLIVRNRRSSARARLTLSTNRWPIRKTTRGGSAGAGGGFSLPLHQASDRAGDGG